MRSAPIPPEEYNPGNPYTEEQLRADGYAAGLDVWEQVGKAYEWYLSHHDHENGDLDNTQLWSLRQAVREELLEEIRRGEVQP